MRRAISYIRFSSEKQARGDSLRRQSKMVAAWLESHPDYFLDDKLTFKDLGKSAYHGKHLKGGLGEFLAAIESGLVKVGDTLLIESLDRLSRQDVDQASELLRNILRAGVDVVTLSDGEHYTKESLKDLLSLIKSILIMQRSHEESQRKGERVQAAWNRKKELAKRGVKLSKRCPAWLKLNDDRKGFTVLPEQVKIVKRAYQLRLEGLAYGRITRTLNEEGYLTLNQYKPTVWSESSVKMLLRNRAVIGHFTPVREEEIQGYYPAVISEGDFYRAQQLQTGQYGRASVSDNPLSVNIFRGLLRCSECGRTMVLGGYSEKRYGMYRCSARSGGGCKAKFISRKQTDETLIALLSRMSRYQPEQSNQLAKLQLQRSSLNKKIQNLVTLAAELDDMTAVLDQLKALKGELSELDREISDETTRTKAIGSAGDLNQIDRSTKAGMTELQLLIKTAVKSIVMNTAKRVCEVTFHNGKTITLPISANPSEDVTAAEQSLAEIAERGLLDIEGFIL
ncbi:recombinase family protein [Pluralibacter gergoviae]|nr:recombinase family protein [Pluralibacter gergoviae]ELW9440312.1 recombinase family protein [Pluralibacter gergoviae]